VAASYVERPPDAEAFLDRAGSFLLEREAEHNLIFGIAGRLRTDPRTYGEDPYFAIALEDARVVGVALRTPPHNLILSEVDDERVLEPLAADVRSEFSSLPGAVGPSPVVERFVRIWEARTGATGRIALRERSYRAEEALAPEGVPGTMRPYEERDRELVIAWMNAFVDEALPEAPPEDSTGWLERRRADPDSGIVIWEDEGPVSLGGYGGPTPNGIRIGPIYTPPELRRRGYASALTAALTAQLLAAGRRFCFLFTDLANPTSNSIYQRIGYRPVADFDQWSFDG
jgi:predicted GNAT family acetyltransferase